MIFRREWSNYCRDDSDQIFFFFSPASPRASAYPPSSFRLFIDKRVARVILQIKPRAPRDAILTGFYGGREGRGRGRRFSPRDIDNTVVGESETRCPPVRRRRRHTFHSLRPSEATQRAESERRSKNKDNDNDNKVTIVIIIAITVTLIIAITAERYRRR